MKQVAVGRKNWLFSGSVAGGERSAGLAPLSWLTLVSSALRNDLDVWQYVKDVLDQPLADVTDYYHLGRGTQISVSPFGEVIPRNLCEGDEDYIVRRKVGAVGRLFCNKMASNTLSLTQR